MIDHQLVVGSGTLEIQDKTDDPTNRVVDLWVGGNAGVDQELVWSYTVDGVTSGLSNFHFAYQPGIPWMHVATIFVGYARSFTFHIEPTPPGAAFTGPQDFTVDLFAGSGAKTVSIKVGDYYQRAIPFVNVAGVWTPVTAMVMLNSEWKEAT